MKFDSMPEGTTLRIGDRPFAGADRNIVIDMVRLRGTVDQIAPQTQKLARGG